MVYPKTKFLCTSKNKRFCQIWKSQAQTLNEKKCTGGYEDVDKAIFQGFLAKKETKYAH